MLLNHHLSRPLKRRLNRRDTEWVGPGLRPPPPNYIGMALRAWRHAIRARRKLMKLAPEIWDMGVVKRLARERAEDEKLQAEMRAAIARVYGVSEADLPPPPNHDPFSWKRTAQTKRAIERAESEREFWLHMADLAYEQFQSRRPHGWLTLSQIADLLDVASQLGRLATGLETFDHEPEQRIEPHLSFRAALEKIYGSGNAEPAPAQK